MKERKKERKKRIIKYLHFQFHVFYYPSMLIFFIRVILASPFPISLNNLINFSVIFIPSYSVAIALCTSSLLLKLHNTQVLNTVMKCGKC